MEKLFGALRAKHYGYDVVDVRFTFDASKSMYMSFSEFDAAMAYAVENAVEVDVATMFPA